MEFYNEYIDYIFYNVAYCQGDTFMTYEQFIEQVKWEVEDIARESFDDVRTVVRTVTKNNNVRRKTISIFKEGQLATPTIYLRDYYLDYKKGRSI